LYVQLEYYHPFYAEVVKLVTSFREFGPEFYMLILFLGTLAKLRKVTIGFVMFVCPRIRPPVLVEQLDCYWTDFREL
jgi:hypothetical protein